MKRAFAGSLAASVALTTRRVLLLVRRLYQQISAARFSAYAEALS
jgi:hypothetical protein